MLLHNAVSNNKKILYIKKMYAYVLFYLYAIKDKTEETKGLKEYKRNYYTIFR